MPAGIDQKVEIWKNKLLDLGKRNRLINYRETKRSTLSIKTPEIFELWESFVENNNPLEFPYYRELQEETDVENVGITMMCDKQEKRIANRNGMC